MIEVSVRKIVDWDEALDDALFTINKETKNKKPSDAWIARACLAEHSMVREPRYIVEIKGIECWSSQHIARHDAFAGHTVRESKEIHFVGTSRSDRTGIDRNKLPQDAPVNHRISLSAQDFITISKLRLCSKSSPETRRNWKMVLSDLAKIDPILASKCVRTCIYRGFCPEFECCGYDKTPAFQEELEEYRKVK